MPTYVCPTCQKALEVDRREQAPNRPFCCERCRMIDLSRWFNEEYHVESAQSFEDHDLPGDSAPNPPGA